MANQLPSVDVPSLIQKMERRSLDGAIAPSTPPVWGKLERVPFVRILGQAAFWKGDERINYEQRMEDLVTSAYGQDLLFLYLVIGRGPDLGLYIGLQGPQDELVLRSMLGGMYPGIELAESSRRSLGSMLNEAGFFLHRARLTGIPTRKSVEGTARPEKVSISQNQPRGRNNVGEGQQIERLMRGMSGVSWGYLICATPYPRSEVVSLAYDCLEKIAAVAGCYRPHCLTEIGPIPAK